MTEQQLADNWINELEAEGLTPDQMIKVFRLAREKYLETNKVKLIPWIPIEEIGSFITEIEILFDTGEVMKYSDEPWPYSVVTHFRSIVQYEN